MTTEKKPETGTPLASRRAFFRGTAAGAAVGLLGMMAGYSHSSLRENHFPHPQLARKDIGLVRGVKVTNISETSWFDNGVLMGDIRGAGGLLVNQYTYNWAPFSTKGGKLASGSYQDGIKPIKSLIPGDLEKAWEYQMENAVNPLNAGGFAALVEIETMEGETKRILLDSGWSYDWMDKAFKREGIDRMLANHEIDMLILSHEHFDHFWGLPVTYKYDPTIETHIPEGFYPEGLQYIVDSGHRGQLITHPNGLNQIMPGVASYTFPVPIICRVYGEQSLYVNVAGAGLVSITGCCHQGIIQFAETARKEIAFDKFHGLYGGLHISPFDDWDPKYDDLVYAMKEYGFEKVGCNHCTGEVTARKFIAAGYPVVQGSARNGSKTNVYLGNGDTIEFRAA
jgi:7,8-dihydropterin-6-yl-methyl-4-(beta-D-ribofuranosyl)aminobenzene 5'-phosphate synthase